VFNFIIIIIICSFYCLVSGIGFEISYQLALGILMLCPCKTLVVYDEEQ